MAFGAKNIQFSSFSEFVKQIEAGNISLRADRGMAHKWASFKGPYCPEHITKLTLRSNLVLIASVIGFLGYAIFTGAWALILGLIPMFFFLLLLHPSGRATMPRFTGFLTMSLWISVIYSAFGGGPNWLLALSLAILINDLTIYNLYHQTMQAFIQANTKHEDLFVSFWNSGHIGFDTKEGDMHFAHQISYANHTYKRFDEKTEEVIKEEDLNIAVAIMIYALYGRQMENEKALNFSLSALTQFRSEDEKQVRDAGALIKRSVEWQTTMMKDNYKLITIRLICAENIKRHLKVA